MIDPKTIGLLNYDPEEDEAELQSQIQELRDTAKYNSDSHGVGAFALDALKALGNTANLDTRKSKTFCGQVLDVIACMKSGNLDRTDAKQSFKDIRQQYLGK